MHHPANDTHDALPPEVADLAADADVPGPRCPACGRPTARRSLVASCAFRHAGHRGDDGEEVDR